MIYIPLNIHKPSTSAGYYQLNLIGRDTMQSSTYHRGVSGLAVDGNRNNTFDYGKEQCTHTKTTRNPRAWWAVDLGSIYLLHSVSIVHRKERCCGKHNKYVLIITFGNQDFPFSSKGALRILKNFNVIDHRVLFLSKKFQTVT